MTKTNKEANYINNLEVKYEIVKDKFDLAQQLATNENFYKYWFEQLSLPENKEKTKVEVFNNVNDLYMIIFKTKKGRYSSYKSFMNTVSRWRK